MREPDKHLDELAHQVLGAAIEVHRTLGPGFLESVYEEALAIEWGRQKIPFERQVSVAVEYKGAQVGLSRPDFIVGGLLIVELKAVEVILPVHKAQVISYLKATHLNLALLINFNVPLFKQGIERIILSD